MDGSIRYGFGNPDKGWITPIDALIEKDAFKSTDINFNASSTNNKTAIATHAQHAAPGDENNRQKQ